MSNPVNKIIKKVVRKVDKVIDQVFVSGRKSIPPRFDFFVNKYKNEIIDRMIIVRTPVNAIITNLFKVLSTVPYDKLFHLQLHIIFKNGKTVMIEKNEKLNSDVHPRINKDSEQYEIDPSFIPDNRSLGSLIHNTEQFMGDKFIQYSASSSNCQDFVLSVLKSNGIDSNDYNEFIKQDTQSIFKGHTNLRKFANTVTQAVDRASILFGRGNDNQEDDVEGGALKKPIKNKWIKHVMDYAKEHNLSFREAMGPAKKTYNK